MEEDQSHMTEMIFDLTLEIIYLLTGEKYAAVKMACVDGLLRGVYPPVPLGGSLSQTPIMKPLSESHMPESNNQKILEVTNRIIELLIVDESDAGSPVSMEEERGQKETMTEEQSALTSPDVIMEKSSREKCSHPPVSRDSNQEEIHCHDLADRMKFKAEVKQEEEELSMPAALSCQVEKERLEVGTAGQSNVLSASEEHSHLPPTSGAINQDSIGGKPLLQKIPPGLHSVTTLPKFHEPNQISSSKLHTVTPNIYTGPHSMAALTKLPEPEKSPKSHTVTQNIYSGPHSVAASTKLFEPKATSSPEVHLTPHIYPELQGAECSTDPSSLDKCPWPTVTSNANSSANRSSDPSNPVEGPPEISDKCTPDIKPVFQTEYRPPEPNHCHELDQSHSVTQNIALGLSAMYRSLYTTHPESPPSTVTQCTEQMEDTYPCLECWKYFTSYEDLVEHRRVHTGDQSDEGFNQNMAFGFQQKHVTNKIFQCIECGICFPNSMDLIKHCYRIHAKEKPYPCSECGKCYTQKAHLVNHQRIHTGENIFPCADCGRCFTLKSQYIKHVRTHTGEKPYSCPECGRCFAQKSTLDNHHSVHTGERPFSCLECGKRFVRKSTLQKHLEIHAGVNRKPKRS